MRVAVIGLGRMGSVSAACLAHLGHHVIGVDRDLAKVDALTQGRAPVEEKNLARLIAAAKRGGLICGMASLEQAVADCEVALVCVDTPPTARGSLNLRNVLDVCRRLRAVTATTSSRAPVIAMRCTLPPGTLDSKLAPMFRGSKVTLCFHPDFTREGSAVSDFMHPSRIVIGARRKSDARQLRQLYGALKAPVFVTTWTEAEILKCADNAFHALKITFANEIGAICGAFGVDPARVMELVCADRTLNLSEAYFRPGLPFGGPCLSKDTGVLVRCAKDRGIRTWLLRSILISNEAQLAAIADQISRNGVGSVGFIGLSFKSGVTDLRGSQYLELATLLHARGIKVLLTSDRRSALSVEPGANGVNSTGFIARRSKTELLRDAELVFFLLPTILTRRARSRRSV